ncbi:RES domain-containing protein [Burkholderia sp. SCN-KJ]|uniref:RES domain-containing protein n=1 Tax=Burkholderia sp. SCN-KJ TaxID=2969248 RepID=UPI00214FDE97|nr:RES domain-containing protein [Burkholderia sp. SCN-KJ]MCR4471602.1 RES domain-containing protein [Burkholderia sp. SCN-KJ]
MGKHQLVGPPPDIAESMPAVEQLVTALERSTRTVGPVLHRAAYSPAGILPERVWNPYRFGPPKALIEVDGSVPFGWLYLAPEPETTVWEARFACNDARRPGTFYLNSQAERDGLIATLTFPRKLRVWDLGAPASSLLGIYDQLSSPDHEWCQWFGVRLYQAMQQVGPAQRPDGALYPSRRYRGEGAIILSFEALAPLRAGITYTTTPFIQHATYAELQGDPLRCEPPEPTVGRADVEF